MKEKTKLYPIEKHGIYIVLPIALPEKACKQRADAFSDRLDAKDGHIPKGGGTRIKFENEIIVEKHAKHTDKTGSRGTVTRINKTREPN